MKKMLIFIFLFILFGCSLSNTPTSKVEELLMKYQKVDKDIKDDIEMVLSDDSLTLDQKKRYESLLERQYKNMSYEIKDERIDGDSAIITVAIKVYDYKKVIQEVENKYADIKDYDIVKYNDEKLDLLEKSNEKVTYTLELNVTKNSEGDWKADDLSILDKKKIQGMY